MTAKKRILLVLRRMGMGGIEQATKTLAMALDQQGHDVHLLILKGPVPPLDEPGYQIHHYDVDRESRTGLGRLNHLADKAILSPLIKHSGFVWRGKRCSNEFKRWLKAQEEKCGPFDLILIRGQGAFENLWAFNDYRTWRVVEAVTGRFAYSAKGRWLTRTLYQDKQLLFVSRGVQEEVGAYLARQQVSIARTALLYNAVPVELIRKKALEPHSPNIASPYIVHVARLVPVKNQERLLKAYHIAINQGLDQDLVIIGDGSERRRLEDLTITLGLASRVHFLGQQENPYPWVKGAHALVLSSNFEGLGIVLLEALSLGVQCVACRVPGGIAEVLTGPQERLLAHPSEEGLAKKLLEAKHQPVMIEHQMIEVFEPKTIIAQLLELAPIVSEDAYAHPA